MSAECSAGNVPPGYKQTEVGVIPEDWDVKALGSLIISLDAGVSVNSVEKERDVYAHNASILKTSCVTGGKFIPEECKTIAPYEIHRAKLNPHKDSIIISRMNTKELVGECGYVDKDYTNLFLPDRLWMTRYNDRIPHSVRWLAYLLSSNSFNHVIKDSATGTSGSMKNISKDSILSVYVPFPPIAEQESIAEALSDTDALIESFEQLIAKKRQIKQGAMQELLTGKRRLPGFGEGKGYKQTEVGVIPKDWDVRSAGEICKVNQGLQIAISDRLKIPSPNSKKYITIQYLNEGKEAEYIDSYSQAVCCNRNDVLMTRTGNTGILITNVDGVFHNNFFKINYDKKLITKEHLVNFLRLEQTQKQILIKAGTSTIPDLNHSDFYSIYIVIPPLAEQETISAILSDMDSEITILEEKLAKARQIKQGMMQGLLTGKIRLI